MTSPITGLFATTADFVGTLPTWYPSPDIARRIAMYDFYYSLYWGEPRILQFSIRDADTPPIYVPAARTIVDTTHRYVAKGISVAPNPEFGSETEQATAKVWIDAFLRRERFYSRFSGVKRTVLMKGEACMLISADPLKPQGSRISLTPVDPATWIPAYKDTRGEHQVGVDLIETFTEEGTDGILVRRQRWMKGDHPARGGTPLDPITYQVDIIKQEDFNDGEEAAVFRSEFPQTPLDARITALPVYHFKNFEEDDNPFGSSELRGVERLALAMTTNMSDADIALALQGIGLYATTGGAPRNAAGEEQDWIIAPGQVLEIGSDKKFERVNGISTMDPYHNHIQELYDYLRDGTGTPVVATGKVEVAIAESGISLTLQMGPMLAKAEDKDELLRDSLHQMFFDLKTWAAVYEGVNMGLADFDVYFGPKLPQNQQERITNIIAMSSATPPIISTQTARDMLREMDYDIPDDEALSILEETAAMATESDPVGGRLGEEAVSEDPVV
jgi:hypothetical protein